MHFYRNILPNIFFPVLLFFFSISSANGGNLEKIIFLEGNFENDSSQISCAFFSGNANPIETAPNSEGNTYLKHSSIGCAMPGNIGWVVPGAAGLPEEPANAAEQMVKEGYGHLYAMKKIFHSYYQNEDHTDPQDIYLAYDWFTNGNVNIGGAGNIEVQIDGDIYNAEMIFDKNNSEIAKKFLFSAFKINPYLKYPVDGSMVDLRYLLLDIPYYQSAALLMQGNLALERAFYIRFFENIRQSGPIINEELRYLGWNVSADSLDMLNTMGAWKYFNEASQVWLDVFASPIQREYLLEFAPARTLDYKDHPAFRDTYRPTGLPSGESWPPVVYEGYQDVAAMMTALSKRARVIQEVASRLVLKLEPTQATNLIEHYVQEIALEESVIMSMFFPEGLPENHRTQYPGMAESFLELRDVIGNLEDIREKAENHRLNALGFDKDVLFIRAIEPGSINRTLYTYNWMKSQLLANETDPIGALGVSYRNDEKAKQSRINFDLKATSYLSEFDGIENEYNSQLIALCGSDPHNSSLPNLTDPLNGGGLLQQQTDNVNVALNAISRVKRLMENVNSRIKIEQERVEALGVVSDKRIRIIYQTGNKVADLQQKIADIEARITFTSGAVDGFSSILGGLGIGKNNSPDPGKILGGLAKTASAAAIARMQRKIGEKKAAITKLQTEKEARFEYFQKEANSINSAAQIKSWFLELRTLEIDLYDAEIRYTQEVNRLAQMFTEIENKVMRRDRALERLTRRSFADPTYRIEVTSAALKAEDSFRTAQIWVYLMAKALAYKWPLKDSDEDVEIFLADILQSRTAQELKDIVDQMRDYDMKNQVNPPGASYYYWNYSLRKDYLGMTFEKEISAGKTQTAVEQFQEYLIVLKGNPDNITQIGSKSFLAIPFSTVAFNIEDDSVGFVTLQDSENISRYASATPIFQTGLWDSKIDWVQVNIVGHNVNQINSQSMEIFLSYGGSTFVRTKDSFPSSTDPDVSIDFLAYGNPAYGFSFPRRGFGWNAMDYIRQKMVAKLVSDPRMIPEVVFKNEAFRERPVAATDWQLLLPVNETNLENIRDIEVNILYTARTRQW